MPARWSMFTTMTMMFMMVTMIIHDDPEYCAGACRKCLVIMIMFVRVMTNKIMCMAVCVSIVLLLCDVVDDAEKLRYHFDNQVFPGSRRDVHLFLHKSG